MSHMICKMANAITDDMADQDSGITFSNGQLSFIGRDVTSIPPHLANSYGTVVTRLDLSFNRLQSLEGLHLFPNLEELILDNNELSDYLSFPKMKKLHTLMLNKNCLKDLESLLEKVNKNLPALTYLSLLGNEACPNQLSSLEKDEEDYQRYRLYVLYRLPNLNFLDSTPVKNTEREKAKKQGQFLKVVRPNADNVKTSKSDEESGLPYSPLPKNVREEPDYQASFGKCKYVYYGKHSEGNRFIRDNDL